VRTLSYDAAGRITATKHTGGAGAALDQRYGYDGLDRLTDFDSASTSQRFQYDANGNRTRATFGAASYVNTISATSNRLASTAGLAPARLNSYDATGNVVSDGTIQYKYGSDGRLSSVVRGGVTTGYRYNGLGQRVAKTGTAGAVAHYVYDEAGRLVGEYDGAGKAIQETVYMGDLPVAVLKPAATTAGTQGSSTAGIYYAYADHLTTPRVLTRASDNKMVWDGADPFGLDQPDENPSRVGLFTYNPRFPGQVFDKETNNHYNYHRHYDPQTGRYMQSDPIGLRGGINTYGYVGANPLSLSDPSGLQAQESLSPRRPSVPGPFDVFVPGTQANNSFVSSVWNLIKKQPKEASSFPPGVWPGDKGADEWGRRNGLGSKEGRGRSHGIKQDCPGSQPTDVYGVNPETGDVYDPEGEVVGNLEDEKRE
jgi:RHS repeat-associated protein